MILRGRLLIRADEAPQPGWIRVAEGRIVDVAHGEPPQTPDAGNADSLICPGFTDAHIHLSQIRIVGCESRDLLTWLGDVVYPTEHRWHDAEVARAEAREAYRRMLSAGTMAYAGFLTSHQEGVAAVMSAGDELPLRGLVGQVLMDRNAPQTLLTGGEGRKPADLATSQRARLALSINPRFAVACTDEMLAQAAARATGATFVHTHLAESAGECDLVAELFPGDPHYTGVYDRHGLLGDRTLLAHCLHLDEPQWQLIAKRRCVVVHCPTANTFLSAGLFDLGTARRHGVRLALGTDVAAGPVEPISLPTLAILYLGIPKKYLLAA